MEPGRYVVAQVQPEDWVALRRLVAELDPESCWGSDEKYVRAGLRTVLSEARFAEFARRFAAIAPTGLLTTYAEKIWSPAELDEADWLRVEVVSPAPTPSGPQVGSEYDTRDACPECWAGARLVGPLKIRSPVALAGGSLLRAWNGELLFAAPVVRTLSGCGLEFRPLEVPGWWSAQATETLPPAAGGVLLQWGCRACGRSGFRPDPEAATDLAYRPYRPAHDVVCTWEGFGPYNRGNVLSHPALVVRQSLRRRLLRWAPDSCEFFPVVGLT